MKKANLVLMAALAAAGLVGVAGGSLLPVSVAVAAEKEKPAAKQKLSPAIQKPLVAAQNAMTTPEVPACASWPICPSGQPSG